MPGPNDWIRDGIAPGPSDRLRAALREGLYPESSKTGINPRISESRNPIVDFFSEPLYSAQSGNTSGATQADANVKVFSSAMSNGYLATVIDTALSSDRRPVSVRDFDAIMLKATTTRADADTDSSLWPEEYGTSAVGGVSGSITIKRRVHAVVNRVHAARGKRLFDMLKGYVHAPSSTQVHRLLVSSDGTVDGDPLGSDAADTAIGQVSTYLTYRFAEVVPINGTYPFDAPGGSGAPGPGGGDSEGREPFMHAILRNLAKLTMIAMVMVADINEAPPGTAVEVMQAKALNLANVFGIAYGTTVSADSSASAASAAGGGGGQFLVSETVRSTETADEDKMLEDYTGASLDQVTIDNVATSVSLAKKQATLEHESRTMDRVQGNLRTLSYNEEQIRVRLQFMRGLVAGTAVLSFLAVSAMGYALATSNGMVLFGVAFVFLVVLLAYELYDGMLATIKALD